MDAISLIEKYYPAGRVAHRILLRHSMKVAVKAKAVAGFLQNREPVDAVFVEEAALLHDIGVLYTDAPDLGCTGDLPYLAHAYMGRQLLETEGWPRHALVCDRHIGVGLSADEIRAASLPLPQRDMIPVSVEEQIVTYADLFFSKNPRENHRERSPEEVRKTLARFGKEKVLIFDAWHLRFSD